MVRSALGNRGGTGPLAKGPRAFAAYYPAATVVAGSMMSLLPIVSHSGWWPDWGLLMLVAWRLLRADPFPAWWAAPLGFVNDLIVGNPIGLSVALWAAIMVAMDILDRRTMWRDYWIEWAIACLFIALDELAQWQVAALLGAPVPMRLSTTPAIILSILCFPIAAFLAARIDRWRLGR
ncbi:rod shape-determining protein MreD [Sphingomonas sp. LY160]|jgi:rod shape-determining protein MreD|uniref:rod shape-determining protein MreD n=1 Tax=Sphingomonas sp. LY160 TaxID=3095342 RepID=UPI002ADEE0A0|nr:rod shape-determining protein MreD [Sphingomonas sp. LY160]MEA1071048.1 rod shape-determining protein MreD [Sphingomonas sp. LY160]